MNTKKLIQLLIINPPSENIELLLATSYHVLQPDHVLLIGHMLVQQPSLVEGVPSVPLAMISSLPLPRQTGGAGVDYFTKI